MRNKKISTNLLYLFFLLLCICFYTISNAQNIIYSSTVGNSSYTQAKIIGKIKEHIIIFKRSLTDTKSAAFLIFDNEMKLERSVSFKGFFPPGTIIDFISDTYSFDAIVQYQAENVYLCKMLVFDDNANLVRSQTIDSFALSSNNLFFNYEILKSSKQNSFIIENAQYSQGTNTFNIKYFFIKNNEPTHSDNIILPRSSGFAGFGKIILEDDCLVIPVNDTTNSISTLSVYKINLSDNSSINTLRSLTNGYLISPSIDVTYNGMFYTIASEWSKRDTDVNNENSVFVWQLNKDLTDLSTDTIFFNNDSLNKCLPGLNHFWVNIITNKNSIVFLGSKNYFLDMKNFYSPVRTYTQQIPGITSFYSGRVESVNYSQSIGTLRNDGPTYIKYSSGGSSVKTKAIDQHLKLIFLNLDTNNNLKAINCFDNMMEEGFNSIVNKPVFVKTQIFLHAVYLKTTEKDKQILSDIKFDDKGAYTIKSFSSINIKYNYLLDQSVQVDKNTLIIPGVLQGKLSFAKLQLD